MFVVEDGEGRRCECILGMRMGYKSGGEVGWEQFGSLIEDSVVKDHLWPIIEMYLYTGDELCLEQTLVIVYIHLN